LPIFDDQKSLKPYSGTQEESAGRAAFNRRYTKFDLARPQAENQKDKVVFFSPLCLDSKFFAEFFPNGKASSEKG
jgi:hypothetical protein